MVAPNPLAARRRTNSSSFSVAVPSSWEESVVSGAIANRFAISRPLLNLKGDQTTIDQTSVIPQAGRHRMEARSLQLDKAYREAEVSNRWNNALATKAPSMQPSIPATNSASHGNAWFVEKPCRAGVFGILPRSVERAVRSCLA